MTATITEIERSIAGLAEALRQGAIKSEAEYKTVSEQLATYRKIAEDGQSVQKRATVDTGQENHIAKQMSDEARKYYEIAAKIARGDATDTGFVKFKVPRLDLPPIDFRTTDAAHFASARLAAMDEFGRYPATIHKLAESLGVLKEAVGTGTAGLAMAVIGAPPIVLVPNDIVANLRDTVQNVEMGQGGNIARFSTLTIPAFAGLSQNTEPSDVSQTWATIDATPVEVGAEQNISYSAQQKMVGDGLAAIVMTFRIAELVHEDGTILTALDAATGSNGTVTNTIASDAGAPVDASNGTEATIDSTDVFSGALISKAVGKLGQRGVKGNLVAVLDPVQFEALFEDSNLVRFMQETGQDNMLQTYQATGIIPYYAGAEIRQSTKIVYGSGSGSPPVTTRHAMVYQKMTAAGLAFSRDLTIATQRREWLNSTLIKASIDYACSALVTKAIECVITA